MMEFAISRFNLHYVKDMPEAASLEIQHTEDLRLLQISSDLGKIIQMNQN